MEDYKIFNVYDSEKKGDPMPILFLYEKYENSSHKKILDLISKLGEFNQTGIYLQKIGFHGWKFWLSKDHEFYSQLKKYQKTIHTQKQAAEIVFEEIPDLLDIKYAKSLPPEEKLEELYRYFKDSLRGSSYYNDDDHFNSYKVNSFRKRGYYDQEYYDEGDIYNKPNVVSSTEADLWNYIVKEMIEKQTRK